MSSIFFSVVVPVFNKGASIERMLASVLNQQYLPSEIIIINDGSTDNSIQLINNYNHIFRGIVKVIDQPNLGVSAARNAGISACSFNYIALLDADDEWLPCHLSDIHTLIRKYPNSIAYSCSHIVHDSTNNFQTKKEVIGNSKFILINNFFVTSAKHNILNSSTVVLNFKRIQNPKIFPEGVKVGEDLFAWFSIMGNESIGYCNHNGVVIHKENDIQRDKRQLLPSYLIKYIYSNKIKLNKDEYKYIWRIWVAHYYGSIINKQKKLSLKYIKYGLRVFGLKIFLHIVVLIIPSHVLKIARNIYRVKKI